VPATRENGAVRIRTLELVDPRPLGSKLVTREQAEIVCEDGRGLFFISRASNMFNFVNEVPLLARAVEELPLSSAALRPETSCGESGGEEDKVWAGEVLPACCGNS